MVTIGMNYFVLEGKEEVFEAAFDRVLQALDGAEGHDESRLYRRLGDCNPEYLIVSRWSDEKAFQEFVAKERRGPIVAKAEHCGQIALPRLVPLGALDRDPEIYGPDGMETEVAHTLQMRMIVKF